MLKIVHSSGDLLQPRQTNTGAVPLEDPVCRWLPLVGDPRELPVESAVSDGVDPIIMPMEVVSSHQSSHDSEKQVVDGRENEPNISPRQCLLKVNQAVCH